MRPRVAYESLKKVTLGLGECDVTDDIRDILDKIWKDLLTEEDRKFINGRGDVIPSKSDEEAATFGREMAEVFGNKDISIHEMSCVLNELTEDARTVAEMLLEVRPFIPAARRILRRLRGPRAPGTIQEAEEELEYLTARKEYVESLMRGDQTDAAKRFFELEKYRLGDAIKNTESRIEWLKESPQEP
jgi:hypothetical protein